MTGMALRVWHGSLARRRNAVVLAVPCHRSGGRRAAPRLTGFRTRSNAPEPKPAALPHRRAKAVTRHRTPKATPSAYAAFLALARFGLAAGLAGFTPAISSSNRET